MIAYVQPSSFDKEGCVDWADNLFHHLFNFKIERLLKNLPPDHKDEEGRPFWNAVRRMPHPIRYDDNNVSI